jgi:hypothetical protein
LSTPLFIQAHKQKSNAAGRKTLRVRFKQHYLCTQSEFDTRSRDCFLTMTGTIVTHGAVTSEKLTRPKPAKKFPAFYRTGRFITAFTRTRQAPPPPPQSWRSVLILSSLMMDAVTSKNTDLSSQSPSIHTPSVRHVVFTTNSMPLLPG